MKNIITSGLTIAALAVALAGCGGSAATPTPVSSAPVVAPSASAATSAAPSASVPATAATAITVKDFTLDPKDVRVQGGASLAVTNAGPTIHNIAIRDAAGAVVGTTKDLKTGESETITPSLAAGTYTLFCSLPGHESLGIKGTLTVS